MDDIKNMADRVLEYRVSNKLTLVQVSREIGISPITLSKLYNGKNMTEFTKKKIDMFLTGRGF